MGQNEPSHTAQNQIVPILENDKDNPTLSDIEKAFNVEIVTDEFFKKYRDLFLNLKDALDEIVEKDLAIKAEFEKKEVSIVGFAKKLLSQIVFLYFLQKKGWLGVERGKEWDSGSKRFLRELFDGCGDKKIFSTIFSNHFSIRLLDTIEEQTTITTMSSTAKFRFLMADYLILLIITTG